MLNDTKDKDEIEMLKEESQGLASRVPELEESLKLLLIPKDPNDDKNVIVEIRAAAGGDEAAILLVTYLECILNMLKHIIIRQI